MKSYWHIIKHDFYLLCKEFHEQNISLKCLNDSIITLIPRKASPETPDDFRPISLINSALIPYKITCKSASRQDSWLSPSKPIWLHKISDDPDCLAWSFDYLHHCKHAEKGTIILKLDFEKAFDMIEHKAILQILKRKGFDDKWLAWIENILSFATSAIPMVCWARNSSVREGFVMATSSHLCFLLKEQNCFRIWSIIWVLKASWLLLWFLKAKIIRLYNMPMIRCYS